MIGDVLSPAIGAVDLGQHPYWYLGRAGGFVAFTLLLLSMVMGLAVSSRVFDGLLARAWFYDLHKFLSLLVIAAIFFHAFVMLPDPFAGFSIVDLLVPFSSGLRSLPLALGILAFYGTVLVSVSFYATRWIGQRTWRLLHYLTFLVYVFAATHGVWAGTDSDLIEARVFYLATGMSLVFFITYRLLALRSHAMPRKAMNGSGLSAKEPADGYR